MPHPHRLGSGLFCDGHHSPLLHAEPLRTHQHVITACGLSHADRWHVVVSAAGLLPIDRAKRDIEDRVHGIARTDNAGHCDG